MEEPTNAIVCRECGKILQNKAGLSSHMRIAHKDSPKPAVVETEPVKATETVLGPNADADKIEQLRKFVAVSLAEPDLKRMFDLICSKPWVRTYIQREQGEPKGATQMIGINGVRFDIPKGAFLDLPQPIVAMLNESNSISDEFVKAYEITEQNKLGKQL